MCQNTREGVAITPNVPPEYIDVDADVAEYPKKLPTANLSSLQLQKKPGRPKITPTCQVMGCNADISGLRTYYKRYHICTDHCSASSIPVSLLTPRQAQPFLASHSTNNNDPTVTQVRFCQQCGSFHSLDKFKGNRKSCRNALLKVKERHKIRELEKTTNSQLGGKQQQSKKKRMKHYDEVTDSSDEAASAESIGVNYILNVQKGTSHNSCSSCIQQDKSHVQHCVFYTDDDHDDGSHGYNQHHHTIQQTEFMDLFGHSMPSYTEPYLDTFLFDDVDGLFLEDRVGDFVPILAAPLQPKTSTIPPKVFRGAPIDFPQGDDHDAAHLLPPIETAFPGWVKL